jgi:hypothetical protein
MRGASNLFFERIHLMDNTPGTVEARIDALLDHMRQLETLLLEAAQRAAVPPSFHFTCRVGVKKARVDRVFSTHHTACFPKKASSAHVRMAVQALVPSFNTHLHAIQQVLSHLAEAFVGTPGLTARFSMGVEITERGAFGWFHPGHTGAMENACPGSGHTLHTGAFGGALRVVAAAKGWGEGPVWGLRFRTKGYVHIQAQTAEEAMVQAWALLEPKVFDAQPSDGHALVHIARVLPKTKATLARCRASLPHFAATP